MNMTSLEANKISVVSEQMKMKEPPPVYVSMVEPFLVEALQNHRHRLTMSIDSIDEPGPQNEDYASFEKKTQEIKEKPEDHLNQEAEAVVPPVKIQCARTDEEIRRAIKPLVNKYFLEETQTPLKFAVLYEARANTGIDRAKIIGAVAKSVPPPLKVDLGSPNLSIVVQIVKIFLVEHCEVSAILSRLRIYAEGRLSSVSRY